jgi:hypothetical protein
MVHNMNAPTSIAAGYLTPADATPRDRLMPHSLDCWNPRNCLVSVVADRGAALRAMAALRAAGFAEADVCLATDRQFVALDETRRARNVLARVIAGMRSLGDESIIAAQYVAEARRGGHIVVVHAPGDALTRRALTIMAGHRAHTMHYYSRWVIRGMATSGGAA